MEQNYMEEISLRELIEILIKRKKLIAIITIISILVAGIVSFFILDPTYESKMLLMASNASDKTTTNNLNGNLDNLLDSITKYPVMNIETYRQQIKSPSVILKTIEDLGVEEEYSIESLASKITLETIKDTQLINIKIVGKDPEKTSEIINKLGENFIEFVTTNAKEKAKSTTDYLTSQMEIEKKNYDGVLLEQKELLSQPRGADEVKLELDALLEQLTEYKTKINDLDIRKEALYASINVAKGMPSSGSSLTLNQNTGRVLLDSSDKTLNLELAEVETSIIVIKEKILSMEEQIEKLRVEYQDKSHKESIINQKVDLAKKTYETFINKYEEIRVTESASIGDASIIIISRALPPTRPIGPRRALNLAIATVLGLMVGVITAFFIEYWQSTEKRQNN